MKKEVIYKFCFLLNIFLLCVFINCERDKSPVMPLKSCPVARIAPVQPVSVRVGNYMVLDGSASTPCKGEKIIWYTWEQSKDNPFELFLAGGGPYDPTCTVGFIKAGTYRISLKVRSHPYKPITLDEILAIPPSDPAEVVVKVKEREQIIFPDPALELSVRYALNKPTGDLTEDELLSLEELHGEEWLGNKEITNLEGIERCVNLSYLDLSFQRLTDLSPISGLTRLTQLHLDQNKVLADISPISGLVNLEHLELFMNNISDISPLKNLKKLKYLHLSYNPITDISVVENFEQLEELHASFCPLESDLSCVKNLKNLKVIWIASSTIKDITPLANLTELRIVNFNFNQIEDISPLANLTKLEWLYLADNKVKDISVLEKLENLERIRLWDNQIEDILPLVKNKGLGKGDLISLQGNPLNEKSINEYIPALRARGVYVGWP